jgi:peptide methionine sulfoxide reductase MsrB
MGLLTMSSARRLSPRGLAFVSPLASRSFGATWNAPSNRCFMTAGSTSTNQKLPVVADESVMSEKAHGTSDKPVMKNLRWNCDYSTADRICNFNRHYAEYSGYWQTTDFLKDIDSNSNEPISFYDSVTGALLFTAPTGRTMKEFLLESQKHGWPSFRDNEVNWDNVRCLVNGECVSVTGTHLGHNIPDSSGNRYCINLVSVAGQPSNKD